MKNQEIFNRFLELKKEILEILIPSSNPDNYTDTEDALNKSEEDLRVALLS
jgi:hypothetical protein